jgi:RNA polymerase sigma-70 factor, ECF subfamily
MDEQSERQAYFARTYRVHYDAIFAYALRRASRPVAEDVVNETFLVAWRRLDDMPVDPLPWLYGVARRVLANQRRGDERRRALLDHLASSEVPVDGVSPGMPEMTASLLPDTMRRALETLSPDALEALLLIAWEELTPAQAARVVGCSQTTMRARLFRARRAMSRALDQASANDAPRAAAPVTSTKKGMSHAD